MDDQDSRREAYANRGSRRDKDPRKDSDRQRPDDRSRRSDRRDDRDDRRSRDDRSSRDDRRDYGRDRNGRDRDRDQGRERDRKQDKERRKSPRRSASPRPRTSAPPRSPSRGSQPRSASPPEEDKAKPNFKPSGLLAADTKTVELTDGTKTVLKYHEPPEARKPLIGWRLYVFKGTEQVDLLHIQRQSAYLVGRDRAVVDIPIEHPSCSKQHAVIQYRQVAEKDEFGTSKPAIKPFIIDLESTNGTSVNDETIPTSRYYELKVNDVIKFGESSREYVLLHDEAA